jgi:hypothetical protein
VRAVEKAASAELRALPAGLGSSTLARAALDLARRLDDSRADREATMLARELRLTMAELHSRAGADVGTELEGFLAGIANPTFRGPGH